MKEEKIPLKRSRRPGEAEEGERAEMEVAISVIISNNIVISVRVFLRPAGLTEPHRTTESPTELQRAPQNYREPHRATESPTELQRAPQSYREPHRGIENPTELQRAPQSYREPHRATESPTELQRAPQSYREPHRATESPTELQRAPQSYREPHRATDSPTELKRTPQCYREPHRGTESPTELQRTPQSYRELFQRAPESYREPHRATESPTELLVLLYCTPSALRSHDRALLLYCTPSALSALITEGRVLKITCLGKEQLLRPDLGRDANTRSAVGFISLRGNPYFCCSSRPSVTKRERLASPLLIRVFSHSTITIIIFFFILIIIIFMVKPPPSVSWLLSAQGEESRPALKPGERTMCPGPRRVTLREGHGSSTDSHLCFGLDPERRQGESARHVTPPVHVIALSMLSHTAPAPRLTSCRCCRRRMKSACTQSASLQVPDLTSGGRQREDETNKP
ncbi:hypothetical protein JZ751_014973 [Albula glossodonta]|uniref:Uncharacterized protein n=1 Tax=Albula glossodonta TaxID=121402 RepID=A0A8T2N7A2_9TELE|nr:hypothetical protein JZ751_014973 [Albula glossodonta]